MRNGSPQRLLLSGTRAGRPADLATRASRIGHQQHRIRRARRLRRSLRTAGRVLALGGALLAVLVAALVSVHWLRTARFLAVAAVEVVGARRVAEASVRAAARIEPGTNIFAIDPGAIEDRVQGLPGVRRARVVRQLPNRVSVMVEEREPYALINAVGAGRLLWIDAEGYLVGPERRPGAPPFPILSGVDQAALDPDRPPPDNLRAGLALLRAIQRTGGRVGGRISEIDLAEVGDPVLYMTDGTEVRVGAEGWDERLARLDGVLGDLESRGERVLSVDLRFRDLVVLRPRAIPDGPASAPGSKRPGPTGTGAMPPERG